jgi:hypothetical protein
MISPESRKLLEELGKTQFGRALIEYLNDEMEEIADVRNSKTWEETLGRQIALGVIDKLFTFMVERNVVDKSKNRYT